MLGIIMSCLIVGDVYCILCQASESEIHNTLAYPICLVNLSEVQASI